MNTRVSDFLLNCGISREDFGTVRHLLWDRNIRTMNITAILSGSIGAIFLVFNLFTNSGVWFPYLFLFCGSIVSLCLLALTRKSENGREIWRILICYGHMMLICVYAVILTTQKRNYATPATSVIVFIAILPLCIDDRPIRMFLTMTIETAGYLLTSYLFKSHSAFTLDMMNAITFSVVAMFLYGVICMRNVREIRQKVRVEQLQRSIITSLATVVEERDESTGDHIQRTVTYVERLLEKMKKTDKYQFLSKEYCANVILAAPMHDIGKVRIPDAILNKPARLTPEEYEIMKKHSEYGGDIIRKTISGVREKEYCDIAYNIARHHHERYDGTGYPDRLQGEAVPLESRIMALADVYDALISERVYKKAFTKEDARKIILEGKGTQFDPTLVTLFLECVE